MNVVVEINGRKALPVWVLPYVTGWELSPDMLLDRLVTPNYRYQTFPSAFNPDASPIPPNQWEGVAIQVRGFSEKLKADELPLNEDRAEWRKGSIGILMTYKAYVWLNEFQEWFNKQSYAHLKVKWNDDDAPAICPGVTLCLDPLLPPEHAASFLGVSISDYEESVAVFNYGIAQELGETEVFKSATEAVGDGGAGNQAETIGDGRVRVGRYREYDLDAIAWLAEMKNKTDFDLDAITIPQIEAALKGRNSELWGKGKGKTFGGWNRKQRVWPKKKRGIKKGMQRRLKP